MYTLATVGFVFLMLSITAFYLRSTKSEVESYSNKIITDELHYFIESSKKDVGRAAKISSQRATVYTLDYILEENRSLRDYDMVPCTSFDYPINGSQAIIAELMLCGTINGRNTSKSARYMQNHTLLDWRDGIKIKADEASIVFDKLEISDIDILMYDAFHLATIIKLDIIARDKENNSRYVGRDIPAAIAVSHIDIFEDPLYYLMTKDVAVNGTGLTANLMKYFSRCSFKQWNGTTVDAILTLSGQADYRCYYVSNVSECWGEGIGYKLNETGPCFFDRLEGKLSLSRRYRDQSVKYFNNSNIGLESFVNLQNLWNHSVPVVQANNSWIDYMYWQNITGDCCVNGTRLYIPQNWSFRIDEKHNLKYKFDKTICYLGDVCTHT